MTSPPMDAFDFVIVGGGTAACALASRLQAYAPHLSIAVFERGPDERQHEYVTNPLAAGLLPTTELVSNYETEPQSILANRKVINYAGNILSGSSAINYGAWLRAHSVDYDQWSSLLPADDAGAEQWKYEALLPYLKRVEHHHDPSASPEIHGFDGPIHTESGRKYPLRSAIAGAFNAVGYSSIPDVNTGKPLGLAPWTENWFRGKRQPAGSAYNLDGIHLFHTTPVTQVMISKTSAGDGHGDKAIAKGVVLMNGRKILAKKETIVCCGAHRTPQMLMLSGVGPSAELSKHGLETIVDSPEVGKNFFDHLALHQAWRLTKSAQDMGAAAGHPKFNKPKYAEGIPVEWLATGTVSSAGLKQALQADAADGQIVEDNHPHLTPPRAHYQIMTAYSPLSLGPGHDVPIDGTHISTGALLYLPTVRGTVTLASKDPTAKPVVNPGYYSKAADRYMLREALRQAMRAIESEPLRDVIEAETPPPGLPALTSRSSDEDIDERVKQYSTVWHHGAGTAALGKVVDSQLRVNGVTGLRIVDASVFPAPISATLQATVYAIAEKAADMLAKQYVGP